MQLRDGIEVVDRGVTLYDEYLVISDLHLGRNQTGYSSGTYPETEHQKLHERLKELAQGTSANKLILCGDLFQRGYVPDKRDEGFLTHLSQAFSEVHLIEGNHENARGGFPSLVDSYAETKMELRIRDVVLSHGDTIPKLMGDVFVIGHVHPYKNGKPCFMWGEKVYKGSDVLVLPPFSDEVRGSDVSNMERSNHCPLLAKTSGIDLFETFVSK